MDPLLGTSVSHNTLTRPPDRAGMGVVYEAVDPPPGRCVALEPKYGVPEFDRLYPECATGA